MNLAAPSARGQLRPCMVPHVKAVSRPFGRWPKASLYMGMMHGPRSSPGAAADTLSTFIGKKLRIHTGANRCHGRRRTVPIAMPSPCICRRTTQGRRGAVRASGWSKSKVCQWRREIPQNLRAEIPHFILIRHGQIPPRRSDIGEGIEGCPAGFRARRRTKRHTRPVRQAARRRRLSSFVDDCGGSRSAVAVPADERGIAPVVRHC
jgi:hypothetical protein